MKQPTNQHDQVKEPTSSPSEQYQEIHRRRRETQARVSETRREAVYRANHHGYKAALIQADSLIAEAKRLRSRIELEMLAYERLEEQ
jgi:hypothetical protein